MLRLCLGLILGNGKQPITLLEFTALFSRNLLVDPGKPSDSFHKSLIFNSTGCNLVLHQSDKESGFFVREQ